MIKILTTIAAGAVLCGSLAVVPHANAAQMKVATAAQLATPMKTDELFDLYHNRSWIWNDGSGYFSSKNRRFIASTGRGQTASYAEGRWFLTDPGKLCFKADWHTAKGAAPALTCFSHREKGGTVYQRREPDGQWYVFKNAAAKTATEYSKVRRGDYVSARFNEVEARLSSSK